MSSRSAEGELTTSGLEPIAKGFATAPTLDTRVRELERFQQQQHQHHRKLPVSAGVWVTPAGAGEVSLASTPAQFPTQFRARVVPAGGGVGEIQRMGPLTRESVQALLDDSRFVGRGARLEIRLFAPVVGASRAWLDGLAKSVRRRGVAFDLRSEHDQASWPRSAARAAA